MKYCFNILILSLFANYLGAQEFAIDLVFEDAMGAKDTLTIGYDAGATNGIDATFGETNIISQSWGSGFEVRLSEHMWECDQYYTSNFTYHTERQIKTKECNQAADLVWSVHLKNAVYPVQVSWDSTLFLDTCRSNSLITDWIPCGWWDVTFGAIQGVYLLGEIDTVQFQEPYHKHIAANNDTTDILFLTLANDKQVFVGLEELTPTIEKELIKVVDALGREVKDEPRKLLIYVYSDGTTRKVFRLD